MLKTKRKPKGRKKPNLHQFTAVLAKTGNVYCACTVAGVSRKRVYEKRNTDAWFANSWELALQQYQIRKNYCGPKPRNYRRSIDCDSWHDFFVCLRNTRNVALSARYARVARSVAYNTRDVDPDFCGAWERAMAATSRARIGENLKSRYPRFCQRLERNGGDVAKAAASVGFPLEFAEQLIKRDPRCGLAKAQGVARRTSKHEKTERLST